MDPDSIWQVVFLVAAAVFSAVFKAFSLAFPRLDEAKIDEIADVDEKKARQLRKISQTSEKSSFRAKTVSGIFDAFFAVLLTIFTVSRLYPLWHSVITDTFAAKFLTLLVTFLLLLAVELMLVRPFSVLLGQKNPESFVGGGLSFFKVITALFTPITALFDAVAGALTRAGGLSLIPSEANATEKEIRLMVDEGVIEDTQKEMINNIFEFDDKSVDLVMTHRKDIVGVDCEEASFRQVINIAMETGYSRLPVYREDIDHIIGILYVKDLFGCIHDNSEAEFSAQKLMRTPLYIPESMHCRDLFKKFKDEKTQMAVVIDEYGGTSGIVTMEDVVESIVGNIQDEYDNEQEDIAKVSDNSYRFDGSVPLDEVKRLLDIDIDEDVDYDTLSGFLIHLIGRIPEDGEQLDVPYENVNFHVALVEDKRITTVIATVQPKEEIAENEE